MFLSNRLFVVLSLTLSQLSFILSSPMSTALVLRDPIRPQPEFRKHHFTQKLKSLFHQGKKGQAVNDPKTLTPLNIDVVLNTMKRPQPQALSETEFRLKFLEPKDQSGDQVLLALLKMSKKPMKEREAKFLELTQHLRDHDLQLLGFPKNSQPSAHEINRRLRDIGLKFHPDKLNMKNSEMLKKLQENNIDPKTAFQKVNQAAQRLDENVGQGMLDGYLVNDLKSFRRSGPQKKVQDAKWMWKRVMTDPKKRQMILNTAIKLAITGFLVSVIGGTLQGVIAADSIKDKEVKDKMVAAGAARGAVGGLLAPFELMTLGALTVPATIAKDNVAASVLGVQDREKVNKAAAATGSLATAKLFTGLNPLLSPATGSANGAMHAAIMGNDVGQSAKLGALAGIGLMGEGASTLNSLGQTASKEANQQNHQ